MSNPQVANTWGLECTVSTKRHKCFKCTQNKSISKFSGHCEHQVGAQGVCSLQWA